MSNNYIPIKSPFDKTLANKKLNRFQMGQQLVKVYNWEKNKALKMVGRYSIKKISWLQDELQRAQKQANEMFPPFSQIAKNEEKPTKRPYCDPVFDELDAEY